jgi:hypothetical protein
MKRVIASLLVALAAPPALASDQGSGGGRSGKGLDHYGYGEQPGREAASGARQSGNAARKESRAAQDERRGSAAAQGKGSGRAAGEDPARKPPSEVDRSEQDEKRMGGETPGGSAGR